MTLPESGFWYPATHVRVVDFPAPLGPSSATNSPALTVNESESTAMRPRYFLVSLLTSSIVQKVAPLVNSAGALSRLMKVVAPAGFEPAISALRGLRPRPLDDGAALARPSETNATCSV